MRLVEVVVIAAGRGVGGFVEAAHAQEVGAREGQVAQDEAPRLEDGVDGGGVGGGGVGVPGLGC